MFTFKVYKEIMKIWKYYFSVNPDSHLENFYHN